MTTSARSTSTQAVSQPRRARMIRILIALWASCCVVACSGLSSSDDFVPTESEDTFDTIELDTTDPDTIDTTDPDTIDTTDPDTADPDTTPDPDALDPDARDGFSDSEINFICGALCSQFSQCPDTTLPDPIACSNTCVANQGNDLTPFGCYINVTALVLGQGFEPGSVAINLCPLLDITPFQCPDLLSCLSECGPLHRDCCGGVEPSDCEDPSVQSVGPSCGESCIHLIAGLEDEDTYNCYTAHRSQIEGSPAAEDLPVLCALADGNSKTPNVACDDPCATLCDTLPTACNGHDVRLMYGFSTRTGAPNEADLSACRSFCQDRFFSGAPPTALPYAPHSDVDNLACRLDYVVRAALSQSTALCAFADPASVACTDNPIDYDGDGATGTGDPCPYVSGSIGCETTYCSLAAPDCDGDGTCNNLQTEADHCGACIPDPPCDGPCTGGQCAAPCNTTGSTTPACPAGLTCTAEGFCVACSELASGAACPQGPFCEGIQCEADQTCRFGACILAEADCGTITCGLLEQCSGGVCACGTQTSTTKAACPNKSLCLEDVCSPAPPCGGQYCQPGETCDAGTTCYCGTLGTACARGEFCDQAGACQPIPSSL